MVSALKIMSCKVGGGPVEVDAGTGIELQINPDSISHSREVVFSEDASMASSESGQRFSHMPPGKLDFSVTFDGTGIVPRADGGTTLLDVNEQLQALSGIVYRYEEKMRQPRVVCICWGTLRFFGRLTHFDIDYTLFKPSGTPLRAKVKLSFNYYRSNDEVKQTSDAVANSQVEKAIVSQGDTLVLLCVKKYGDGAYYLAVANYNKLVHFRSLESGVVLLLPPLEILHA